MKEKLESLANIVLIAVLLLVGYVVVKTYLLPPPAIAPPNPGQELTGVTGVNWGEHRQTLVLALKKGCHYCEESAPFYKQLIELHASKTKDLGMIAILPDDARTATAYLRDEGLGELESVAGIDFTKVGVPGTPTAFLIDSAGRVVSSWVGVLTPKQELELKRQAELE